MDLPTRALAILLCVAPLVAPALEPPSIGAKACLLINAGTGEVLYSRDVNAEYPPASTTKLLTALLVYERIGLRGSFAVADADTHVEPSHVPLHPGETVSVRDMVQALLIGSDNDTAMALARYVAGSTARFVNIMNARAKELGCCATYFKNPNGLPAPGQHTTCQDLMRIFNSVLAISSLRSICEMKGFYLSTDVGKQWVKNHNRLLGKYPGMGPAKTGWTVASRHTFAAAARRGDVELRLTLLNSPDKWSDTRALFDYGFARAGISPPPEKSKSARTRSRRATTGS